MSTPEEDREMEIEIRSDREAEEAWLHYAERSDPYDRDSFDLYACHCVRECLCP